MDGANGDGDGGDGCECTRAHRCLGIYYNENIQPVKRERERDESVRVCVCRPETMPQPAAHQIMIIVHV